MVIKKFHRKLSRYLPLTRVDPPFRLAVEAYKYIKRKFDEESPTIPSQDPGLESSTAQSQPPAVISSTSSSPRTNTPTNMSIEMIDDDMKATENENSEIAEVSVKTETPTEIGNSPCVVEFEFDDIEEVENSQKLAPNLDFPPPSSADTIAENPENDPDFEISPRKAHIKSSNRNVSNRSCDFCGFIAKTAYDLKRHIRTHTGEKPFRCDYCKKAFSDASSMRRHRKSFCAMVKYFDAKDRGEVDLDNEFEINNQQQNQQRQGPSSLPLNLPENITRPTHSPFGMPSNTVCDLCGKNFSSKSALKQHILIHSGEKPFKCNFCNKSFNDGSSMRRHRRNFCELAKSYFANMDKPTNFLPSTSSTVASSDGGYSVKIEAIGEADDEAPKYKSNEERLAALRAETAAKDAYKLTCYICDKKFLNPSKLQRHMRVHTGEKPFKCDFCDKVGFQSRFLDLNLF